MIYEGNQIIFDHDEQHSLVRQIQNSQELQQKKTEDGERPLQLKLKKYLNTSGIGDLLVLINISASIAMTVIHAIDTYNWPEPGEDLSSSQDLSNTLYLIEFSINIYFIIDMSLNIFISENKLTFMFLKLNSWVEYISFIPSILIRLGVINASRIILTTRAFRFQLIIKLDLILSKGSQEVQRQIFLLIHSAVFIMWMGSTLLLVVENQNLLFHDYLYFSVVTISTVGFGDIYPKSEYGRIICIAMIIVMLLLMPQRIDNLNRVQLQSSKYARDTFKKKENAIEHIVILGNTNSESYKTFLEEFYHKDHGYTEIPSIIFKNIFPEDNILTLLRQTNYQNKVSYLQGNPLKNSDLSRALVDQSQCVIILADKQAQNPELEDYRNIMYTLSVKQYVNSKTQNDIRVCLQILQPETKVLFNKSLNFNDMDQIICVEELKLNLLAKTCLCPGFNTIISFLMKSTKPDFDGQKKYKPNISKWIYDYRYGMQNEIYRIPLEAVTFMGYTFSQISAQLYKQFSIILFALEVQIYQDSQVFVNPSDYLLENQLHYGYVIAHNYPDINLLNKVQFPETILRNFTFPTAQKKKKQESNLQNLIDEQQNTRHQAFYQNKPGMHSLGLNQFRDQKFTDHFIVYGIVPSLQYLLMPLRAKSLDTITPIIIMNQDPIPTQLWKQLNQYPKVYYLQGSPLKIQDLEKACASKASALVILPKIQDSDNSQASMIDADTIFIYKTVKILNPQIQIISELASLQTITFISQTKKEYIKEVGYYASDPFASGEIYISSMLDTLMCQAYYNPFIIQILKQMIMGGAELSPKQKKMYRQRKLEQGNLFLINLPPQYQDKTFGQLYDGLCTELKVIPMGLYRTRKNLKPYVFIKPHQDIILNSKDKVYIFAYKQPKEKMGQHDQYESELFKPNANGNINIKSKLQGEEGRQDADTAKAVYKIASELKSFQEELQNLNQKQYHQSLTGQDFIFQVRESFRNELTKISKDQQYQ